MKRTYAKKGVQRSEQSVHQDIEAPRDSKAKVETNNQDLNAEIDDLLDEIDEILEQNTTALGITAEQFVSRYVQMGGE